MSAPPDGFEEKPRRKANGAYLRATSLVIQGGQVWTRRSAWLHWMLTAYLWLIAWIPLGNWNRQGDETLLPQLLEGKGLHLDDLAALAFVTAPAVLFWVGYRYRKLWFVVAALAFDAFWGFMQIQSWWVPYILGTNNAWQIRYAQGPTTKVLPSFGRHVAPDGMHLAIHVLLLLAFSTGILATRELRRVSKVAPSEGGS